MLLDLRLHYLDGFSIGRQLYNDCLSMINPDASVMSHQNLLSPCFYRHSREAKQGLQPRHALGDFLSSVFEILPLPASSSCIVGLWCRRSLTAPIRRLRLVV